MSQDGAVGPIFGGETPPQKIDPKKWRQPWRHSMNPVKWKKNPDTSFGDKLLIYPPGGETTIHTDKDKSHRTNL